MKFLAHGKNKILELATSITETTKGLVSGQLVHEYIMAKILEAVPVGEVCMFWGNTVPAGFLRCDGAMYSKITYARLYASRGEATWAQEATRFAVPDFAARYPRGYGWEVSGTYIEDAIRNITGGIGAAGAPSWKDPYHAFSLTGAYSGVPAHASTEQQPTWLSFDASRIVPTASENRPRSVVVIFGIKY